MQIVVFADLHLHNFKSFSRHPLYEGNWRLKVAGDVLSQIIDYAKEQEVDMIVDCGDLFHAKTDAMDFSVLKTLNRSIAGCKIPIYSVRGNHAYRIDQETVLNLFEQKIYPIDSTRYLSNKENNLCFLSYQNKVEYINCLEQMLNGLKQYKTVSKINILFTHGEITGGILRGEQKAKFAISPDVFAGFDYVFAGHLHKHQILADRIIYVGSPLHHNWNDVGDFRGFIHITIKDTKLTYKFISTKYPEFMDINVDSKQKVKQLKDDDSNYYRIIDKPIFQVPDKWNIINSFKFQYKEEILEEPLSFGKDEDVFIEYINIHKEEIDRSNLLLKEIDSKGKEIIRNVESRN